MKLFGQNRHDSGKIKSNNAEDVLEKLHVVKNVQIHGKDIYYFHSQFPAREQNNNKSIKTNEDQ